MMQVPPTTAMLADDLALMLEDALTRTLALTTDLSGERMLGPELPIVNPPLWEVGHVGFFHDHFALHSLYGLDAYQHPDAHELYDSSRIDHADRWQLPLPDWQITRDYLRRVHAEMRARLPDGGRASEAQSYVYQLTCFHEDMHGEAFTYTRQTLGYPAPALPAPGAQFPLTGPLAGDVHVPGGTHELGSDARVPFRFDNEKQPHLRECPAFAIARAPVTHAEFAAFVDDDGYQREALWSAEGWRWRQQQGLDAPVYWRRGQDGWELRRFDRWLPLPADDPVIHVSWYEADAWCRWAGRRLPSELEWEIAASRSPAAGGGLAPGKRRYPWGDEMPKDLPANLDGYRLGCVNVAAFPEGDSAFGCRQMLGNVWEWTDSVFGPYPGFEAELYRDYSEPWFAERRRVLRGGAWATRSRMIHNGYRNFFTPDRNDVLAGFRTCPRPAA